MKVEIDRVCTQGDLARLSMVCMEIKDDLIRINDLIVRGSLAHLEQQDECLKSLTETSRLCDAVVATIMNERLKCFMRMGL